MLAFTEGVPAMPTFQGPLWVTGSGTLVTVTAVMPPALAALCGTSEMAEPTATIPIPANNILAKRFISLFLFEFPNPCGGSGLISEDSFLLSGGTFAEAQQHGNGGRVRFRG